MKTVKIYALISGIICHLSFVLAIILMFFSIAKGLHITPAVFSSPWSLIIDFLLVIQFPLVHSILLSKRWSFLLDYMSPRSIAKQMRPTIFSTIAAWQLIILFSCWQSSALVIYQTSGVAWYIFCCAYLASWFYLSLSISEAGASLQTGLIGWYTVFKQQTPKFPQLPTQGLHGQCRHPIYLAFALILITSPILTVDLLLLDIFWLPYCLFAPLLKERRLSKYNPDLYPAYQAKTPYMLPKIIKYGVFSILHRKSLS